MVKFYEMADGCLIAEAGRGTTKKAIKEQQETWWAKKHGGICNVREYTEEHAIYFALQGKPQTLGEAINQAEKGNR